MPAPSGEKQTQSATEDQAKAPTKKLSSPSYINPHSPQAGDPYEYYVGDIYARIRASEQTSGEKPRDDGKVAQPYLNHIRSLSHNGWPHLRYLADFIDTSTIPIKNKFLTPQDRLERRHRVKVSVINFSSGNCIERRDFNDPTALSHFLNSSSNENQASLFVVEDLSTDTVELLGSRFDVDPTFFRAHLGDYIWFNTRDPWVELPPLESSLKTRPFVHLRYIQPRYFENGASIDIAYKEAGSFNVLRRIEFDGKNKAWADAPGSDVGLVRSSMSLWVKPSTLQKSGWLGILLVDPTITEGYPLWSGYGNFASPPSMHQELSTANPIRSSTFNQIANWAIQMGRENLDLVSREPELFVSEMYRVICSQWLAVLEYTTTRLQQIEWELENEHWRTPQGLEESLRKLHPWRRRIPHYGVLIRSAIRQLEVRYNVATGVDTPWNDTVTDFQGILERLQPIQNRMDKMLPAITAIMTLEDSKKVMQETRNITQITYLAFLFVPMSFVASFLSMNSDFPNGRGTVYWAYFIIALPLSITAMLTAYYWTSPERWRQKRALRRTSTKARRYGK